MKANISVLDKDTTFPKAAAYPFDVIPDVYMQWYKAVLAEGKRLPPPKDFHSKIAFIAQVKKVIGNGTFNIDQLYDFGEMITGFVGKHNQEIVITKNHIYINRQQKPKPAPQHVRVGVSPNQVPVAAWIENDLIKVRNLKTGQDLPFTAGGTELMSSGGRIYYKSGTDICEIVFIESANSTNVGSKIVAKVTSEHGTQLFPGIAFMNLFNGVFACLLPESGTCYQLPLSELNGYNIIDAKCEENVLMVVGVKDGKYDKFIIRFSKEWDSYDVRKIEDINFTGLNFTVLDNGRCISVTEQEEIEIFSCNKDSAAVKSIADPIIQADMRLCHQGAQVLFAQGNALYNFSMK